MSHSHASWPGRKEGHNLNPALMIKLVPTAMPRHDGNGLRVKAHKVKVSYPFLGGSNLPRRSRRCP